MSQEARARKPKEADVEPEDSPKPAHNLESHALSAREQILTSWPLLDLERR